jgi:hypothetical protein
MSEIERISQAAAFSPWSAAGDRPPGFLRGAGLLLAAPAIVRASSLMAVVPWSETQLLQGWCTFPWASSRWLEARANIMAFQFSDPLRIPPHHP